MPRVSYHHQRLFVPRPLRTVLGHKHRARLDRDVRISSGRRTARRATAASALDQQATSDRSRCTTADLAGNQLAGVSRGTKRQNSLGRSRGSLANEVAIVLTGAGFAVMPHVSKKQKLFLRINLTIGEKLNPERQPMKFVIVFATLTAVSAATATIPLAQAQEAMNYPWCASGTGGARNCGFRSFAQCQSDISGTGWFCQKNTQYQSESTKSIWPY
jgi:hypothetical protein